MEVLFGDMTMKLSLILALLFSFKTFAYEVKPNQVKIFVDLTAGDFVMTGKVVQKGVMSRKGSKLKIPKLYTKIKSLKTGIDLRDEHLWKYLGYTKKRRSIYVYKVFMDTKRKIGSAILKVNGIKSKIILKDGKAFKDRLCATFNFKISTFVKKKISYAGIGVKDSAIGKVCISRK